MKRERKHGKMLTGVDFYMKENGTSMQETADKFTQLTEDAWKDLNTDWIVSSSKYPTVAKAILVQVLSYARTAELHYRSREDGFTRPEIMLPHVLALFLDPIIIIIND